MIPQSNLATQTLRMASAWKVGDLVWAKMKSYPWWPALIGDPRKDIKKPTSKKELQFVVFFGTNNYSWVAEDNIKPYYSHVNEFIRCNLSSFKQAMKAVEEYLASPKPRSMPKPKPESPKANGVSPKKRPAELNNKVSKGTPKPKKQRTGTPSPPKSSAVRRPSESSSSGASTSSNKAVNDDRYLPLLSNLSPFLNATPSFNDDNFDWTPKQQPTGLLNRPIVEPVSTEAVDMGNIIKPLPEDCKPPSKLKVGFLGLGIMGTGIAKHLVSAGLQVSVWNRSPIRTYRFKDAGVSVCKTVCDVVQESDVVFSCVSDPAAAKEIVFGKCGVLGSIGPGQGYVEITSIDPKTSKDIESAIQDKGARYLEAPVIGSRELCLSGQLVILAAGDNVLFDECKPCFETFAKHAFYLGAVGNAAKMNILVNMLVGTALASFAESMSLAERVNISQANLLDIMKLGPLRCPLFIDKAKAMMDRDFNPSIRLQHVQNDLQYALQMGNELIQPLPITAAANEVFKHAKCLGYSDHDIAAVYNARY